MLPSDVTRIFAIALAMAAGIAPAVAQFSDFEPSRLASGKPDLNGIWQAIAQVRQIATWKFCKSLTDQVL